MSLTDSFYTSALATLKITHDRQYIFKIEWASLIKTGAMSYPASELPTEWIKALDQYFDFKTEQNCSLNLPYHLENNGVSTQLLESLQEIPQGQFVTYGQLALRFYHKTRAARAVGQILKNNPLPLILPCHRVLPANVNTTEICQIGGYNGNLPELIEIKKQLLLREQVKENWVH